MSTVTLKVIVLGDANVGKSNLITTYTSNYYTGAYTPTVEEIYHKDLSIARTDGESLLVELVIFDLGGAEEYDRLRMLLLEAQETIDAFVLCFKIGDEESARGVTARWKEIADHAGKDVPAVVVGCIADNGADNGTGRGGAANFVWASAYLECSALERRGVSEVFEVVISLGLKKEGKE